ncbi:MAG: T9SS type A sorting domain-containing protein, partial [Saprospiraceae bacterium]
YPDTLLTETLNDGAAWVTLPNLALTKCRLKVEAIGNIFFDISNENFVINVTQPGFALKIAPLTDRISVCAPDSARIDFTVASVGGFNGDVTFVDVQGLPVEATYVFSNNPLSPGESTQLAIYVPTSLAGNEYGITVRVTGTGLDTTERYFNLIVVSNDFSALHLQTPADGENAASLLPTFTWIVGGTVDVFRVQIATGPDFETQTILDELTNTIFSYQPSIVLDENTIYFWRIQPINACGSGAFTKPSAFKTATLVCEEFTTSVPVVISKQGTPTVDSPINVTSIGTVSDVNITSLIGNHEAFKDLKGSLVSPSGKVVDLWASKCGLVNVNFSFGFDDETPTDFECLPNKAKLFKPLMPLSGMVGEAKNGNWNLRITDQVATSGGNLSSWKIKVCGNGSALAPLIVSNQPLPCKPGDEAKVTHEFLKAEDGITNVEYMLFTLVSLPEFGDLHLYGNLMKVGDQFTQADLQVFGALVYDNTQGSTFDGFDFIVQNGLNGFAGIDHFSIVIDVNSSVNPTPQVLHFKVSPNPANSQVLVELGDTGENVQYSLMSIEGKKYLSGDIKGRQLSLSTSGIPAGIYWLQVTGSKGTGIQKLIIQH